MTASHDSKISPQNSFKLFTEKEIEDFLAKENETLEADTTLFQQKIEKFLSLAPQTINRLMQEDIKAYAQIKGVTGLATKETALPTRSVQVIDDKDPSQTYEVKVPDLSNDKLVNFADWYQEKYLLYHFCFLLNAYLYYKKTKSTVDLAIEKEALYLTLEEEMRLALNAYQIRKESERLFLIEDINKRRSELEKLVTEIINQIIINDFYENYIPCGWIGENGHALYLALFFFEKNNEIVIRIDNSGQEEPTILGRLKLNEVTQKKQLINYLVDAISQLIETNGALARTVIYNTQQPKRYNFEILQNNYELLPKQKAPNCVVEGYRRGMWYRLFDKYSTKKDALYHWLLRKAAEYAAVSHDIQQDDAKQMQLRERDRRDSQKLKQRLSASVSVADKQIGGDHKALSPASWHLPAFSTRLFTGRENELNKLRAHYVFSTIPQRAVVSAIVGLGGVGKTYLATYYAQDEKQAYSQRLWFSAETEALLLDDYRKFVEECKLLANAKEASRTEIVTAVKNYLEQRTNWLVIYEGAGPYKEIKDFLPNKGGHILVTTRHQEWSERDQSMILKEFTPADAFSYLNKAYRKDNKDQVSETENTALKTIVHELGGLPLALAQAGAYMYKRGRSAAGYLELYGESKAQLLADKTLPADASSLRTVATTWQLSLAAIQQDEQKEQEPALTLPVLHMLSYLHADAIPMVILQRWLHVMQWAESGHAAKSAFDKVIGHLLDYSMIQVDSEHNALSIHRLVQEVVRDQSLPVITKSPNVSLNTDAKDVLSKPQLQIRLWLNHLMKALLGNVDTKIDTKQEGFTLNNNDLSQLRKHTRLRLHVSSLVEKCQKELAKGITLSNPHDSAFKTLTARLLITLGNYYMHTDNQVEEERFTPFLKRAQGLLEDAKQVCEAEIGILDKQSASVIFDRLKAIDKRLPAVYALALHYLGKVRVNFQNDHHEDPVRYINLAVELRQEIDTHRAECEDVDNLPEFSNTDIFKRVQAIMYAAQGKLAEAETIFQDLLRRYPNDRFNVSICNYELANVYRQYGAQDAKQYDTALMYAEEAIQRSGKQHRRIAERYNMKAHIYLDKGDFNQAADYYDRSLRACNDNQLQDSFMAANAHEGLTNVYLKQKDNIQAYKAIKECVRIRQAIYSNSDPRVQSALNQQTQLEKIMPKAAILPESKVASSMSVAGLEFFGADQKLIKEQAMPMAALVAAFSPIMATPHPATGSDNKDAKVDAKVGGGKKPR